MSKYKFYYPDGKEITDKMQFIEFYSRVYRYVNRKQWDSEVKMENLLDRDKDTRLLTENIARILFWKANRKPKLPEEYAHIGLKSVMEGRNPTDERRKVDRALWAYGHLFSE